MGGPWAGYIIHSSHAEGKPKIAGTASVTHELSHRLQPAVRTGAGAAGDLSESVGQVWGGNNPKTLHTRCYDC